MRTRVPYVSGPHLRSELLGKDGGGAKAGDVGIGDDGRYGGGDGGGGDGGGEGGGGEGGGCLGAIMTPTEPHQGRPERLAAKTWAKRAESELFALPQIWVNFFPEEKGPLRWCTSLENDPLYRW